MPGHGDQPAGQLLLVDVAGEVPVDPLKPPWVEADLRRVHLDLQSAHGSSSLQLVRPSQHSCRSCQPERGSVQSCFTPIHGQGRADRAPSRFPAGQAGPAPDLVQQDASRHSQVQRLGGSGHGDRHPQVGGREHLVRKTGALAAQQDSKWQREVGLPARHARPRRGRRDVAPRCAWAQSRNSAADGAVATGTVNIAPMLAFTATGSY